MIFKPLMFSVRLCVFCPWFSSSSPFVPPSIYTAGYSPPWMHLEHSCLRAFALSTPPPGNAPSRLTPPWVTHCSGISSNTIFLRDTLGEINELSFLFPLIDSIFFPSQERLNMWLYAFRKAYLCVYCLCPAHAVPRSRGHVSFAHPCMSIALKKVWHIIGVQ